MVFDEVCNDLESEGYEVQSFLIPAASVNAPHQRQRIWFIAYSNFNGTYTRLGQVQRKNGEISQWNNYAEFSDTNSFNDASNTISIGRRENVRITNGESNEFNKDGEARNVTNSESKRYKRLHEDGEKNNFNGENTKLWGSVTGHNKKDNFINFPTQSPICGGNDGIPRELDGITFPKWRNESIKGFGNAIVPQVAFEIFKTIITFEEQLKNQ
jgi:DNA (cytosine-5)-methyltransferase 1